MYGNDKSIAILNSINLLLTDEHSEANDVAPHLSHLSFQFGIWTYDAENRLGQRAKYSEHD